MEGANGISRPTTDSLPAYVMVKGVKIQVDIGKLPDRENETLTKEIHVKPARRPLDTPSVIGVIMRRKAERNGPDADAQRFPTSANSDGSTTGIAPGIFCPLARFFTYVVEQAITTAQQAVAAVSPSNSSSSSATDAICTESSSLDAGSWTLVGDECVVVERKLISSLLLVMSA